MMPPIARRIRLPRLAPLITIAASIVLSSCSNSQRLGEYDFREATLALITISPPHAEVFSRIDVPEVDTDRPLETVARVGSEAAEELSARAVRARVDSAGRSIDVSRRIGDRLLQNASRHLRSTPVEGTRADFELEIRIRSYGISAESWRSTAYYFINADMMLLDGATGRRIWETDVRAHDAVRSVRGAGTSVGNVIAAVELSRLSSDEIARELESLSDFAADFLLEQLVEGLDDARG